MKPIHIFFFLVVYMLYAKRRGTPQMPVTQIAPTARTGNDFAERIERLETNIDLYSSKPTIVATYQSLLTRCKIGIPKMFIVSNDEEQSSTNVFYIWTGVKGGLLYLGIQPAAKQPF